MWQQLGFHMTMIRCDIDRENIPKELHRYCSLKGIELKTSPKYAPQSNGLFERLVQENWTRERVLLNSSGLSQNIWGEEIHHANWLRNRSPSARIGNEIPISNGIRINKFLSKSSSHSDNKVTLSSIDLQQQRLKSSYPDLSSPISSACKAMHD